MALSQKHRNSIYTAWAPVLGEEEAEALLSQFPSTDLEVPPATKEFVQLQVGDLRTEMRDEFANVRAEMRDGFANVRAEMRDGFAKMSCDIDDRLRQMIYWITGAFFTCVGVVAAIATVVS